MDIVFQSGDFYNQDSSFWSTFFINAFGALVGALTAFGVFVLTVKHDRKKENKKEEKLIVQSLHYFSSMVNSINEMVKQQSGHIKKCFEKQREDLLNVQLITILPANDLERFSELPNHEDYYHAYLNKFGYTTENVKEYRSFFFLIDYLKAELHQLQDMLEKSLEYDYQRKLEYKGIVEKALDDTEILYNKAKQADKIAEFEKFLNLSLLNFYSGIVNFSDLSEFQTKFVDPVKIGIGERFRQIDIAIKLSGELKKATHIFTNIKMANSDLAEDFENIYTRYKSSSDKLDELTIQLNKRFSGIK